MKTFHYIIYQLQKLFPNLRIPGITLVLGSFVFLFFAVKYFSWHALIIIIVWFAMLLSGIVLNFAQAGLEAFEQEEKDRKDYKELKAYYKKTRGNPFEVSLPPVSLFKQMELEAKFGKINLPKPPTKEKPKESIPKEPKTEISEPERAKNKDGGKVGNNPLNLDLKEDKNTHDRIKEIKAVQPKPVDNQKLLSINYKPSKQFEQGAAFKYPVAMMPKGKYIKPPRIGRSNKRGFKEDDFYRYLENYFSGHFLVCNDRNVLNPTETRQYEPDFVLISKNDKNICLDIEIDEPYEGYTRLPTHEIGRDDRRDQFFINRGWIVLRFTERQVHLNPLECCLFIAKVLASIDDTFEIPYGLEDEGVLAPEEQWNKVQSDKWQKEKYREKYLGIESFGMRVNYESIEVLEASEIERTLESQIEEKYIPFNYSENDNGILAGKNSVKRDKRVKFDPVEHRYFIDDDPDTISVTELIEKFTAPFDKFGVAKWKAEREGLDPQYYIDLWDEAANQGTFLHEQIERYFNELPHDTSMTEMKYFLQFVNDYPGMIPHRTEWRIFDEKHMIAGTVDALFEKTTSNGTEYYIFDWKRSKNVVDYTGEIIPAYYGATCKGDLGHVPDSSFGKYSLQLNVYKYILENLYRDKHGNRIKISSMNLLVLYDQLDGYHLKKVPDMTKEVNYILKAAKFM